MELLEQLFPARYSPTLPIAVVVCVIARGKILKHFPQTGFPKGRKGARARARGGVYFAPFCTF